MIDHPNNQRLDEESLPRRAGPDSDGLGERISQVIACFPTKKEAAEIAEVSVDQLANYVSAKSKPGFLVLGRLAHEADVRLEWLLSGEGPMRHADPYSYDLEKGGLGLADGFVVVPRYEVAASAGSGIEAHFEKVEDEMAFRAEWLRSIGVNAKNAKALWATGDSMEPTIRDGDLLLIDTAVDQIVDNAIYVLSFDGAVMLKRVQRLMEGDVVVKSDNPHYQDERMSPGEIDKLHVVGRVRWHGRVM